ncbi:MAG: hypothetical protein WCR19_05865, partial [Acholeplasmataceae bacterium]
MPSIPSLYTMQWILIGFSIFWYFIIGMLRGTQKSLYFTIVNIITITITIILISQVSIQLVFKFVDQQTFFDFINNLSGGFLTNYMVYLEDEAVLATIFIFVDLVLRIISFFVLLPIIRGFISLVIFRPIWAFIIKKKIINSQNKDYELECEEKGKKYKPRRKIHKNWLSRLLGGLFGSVEGLIAAFIVLIPITVMA